MMPAKVGTYTLVVNEIDPGVAGIKYLCSVYFQHYYQMLPHSPMGIVLSQTAHLLEPD